MMLSFINEMFNFGINNVVGKSIIDKDLFYIFKFIKEDTFEGRRGAKLWKWVFLWLFFYNEKGIHFGNWGCRD